MCRDYRRGSLLHTQSLRQDCQMGLLVRILLLWPLILGALGAAQEDDKPLVETKYGKLRGVTVTVKETDRTVRAFYGIPFAKPPVGPLRFAAPEPPEPWRSVREASEYPPMCVQGRKTMEMMFKIFKAVIPPVSEDCLYLNIFTPAGRENSKLPVMVFIHGGGLSMGGTVMFEGSALSAYEDVVIVTIQYRLGLLGFLSTGDEQAPGNYGFLDQVAALRWVQDNIADFGGDHQTVTIFGESAGGVSVSALLLSPLSRGLFHRAIAESGVALIPGLMGNKPKDVSLIRNSVANVSSCDPASLIDCLRKKTENEMTTISGALGHMIYSGSVDGEFLPKPADEILAGKGVAPIPFIIGVNNHEFGWVIPMSLNISGLREGMDKDYVRETLRNIPMLCLGPDVISLVMDEYFGDTNNTLEIRDRLLDLYGDMMFVMPALGVANYHRDSGVSVYFYEFQHRPSLFKDLKPDFVKADHADEIFFVIGGPFLKDGQIFAGPDTEEEKALSKTVMKYWANFARNGNPNGPGLIHWPQYDQDEDYLQINLKQSSAHKLKAEKYQFWTKTGKIQKTSEDNGDCRER